MVLYLVLLWIPFLQPWTSLKKAWISSCSMVVIPGLLPAHECRWAALLKYLNDFMDPSGMAIDDEEFWS